jgi:hypothetical protein
MKVYFITRFSIYDSDFGGFRLTKDYDPKAYERRLFSKARLKHKFDTLRNITFPSIVQQTYSNWEWLIYSSDRMNNEYRERLRAMMRDHTNIVFKYVKNFREFFEQTSSYNYDKPFATVRIDDDDGLNEYFVEKLQQYSNQVGSIVCFTEGRLAKYVKDKVLIGKRISEKNNAQGLAGIGFNIYSSGRHSDIDTRYHVIYDPSPDMFILTCSPFTDTKRGFTRFDRILGRVRRLFFLLSSRPGEVPKEISRFIRKRIHF